MGQDHIHSEEHERNDGHSHDHEHGAAHRHHTPAGGLLQRLRDLLPVFHGHSHDEPRADVALGSSARGIRALKLSLLGLGATAVFQTVIVAVSGSIALFADTIHNASDALTAVPLWIAFVLARRSATKRFTYGYGRAEDIAGIVIVAMIALTTVLVAYEGYQRLLRPEPMEHIPWVILASIVGFIGNEAVAIYRIRVGKEIGSAALVADGHHARADGLTSLAVLVGALGVVAGFPWADPVVGLLISVALLFVLKNAALIVWHRLMDAVDPALVDHLRHAAVETPGIEEVVVLRMRWLGHRLVAELSIVVDEDCSLREGHDIAEGVSHALLHAQPALAHVVVHTEPCGHSGVDPHLLTAHHLPRTAAKSS